MQAYEPQIQTRFQYLAKRLPTRLHNFLWHHLRAYRLAFGLGIRW